MGVDRDLLAVNRIFQQWASSVGGGIPDARAATETSPPPPLPSDLAIYVDRDYMRAPEEVREFMRLWFRTPLPPDRIAKTLGLGSRTAVYARYRECLWYFRGVFESDGILQRFEARAARMKRRRALRSLPPAVLPDLPAEDTDSC